MLLIQLRGSLQTLVLIAERKRDRELLVMVEEIVRLVRAMDELVRW